MPKVRPKDCSVKIRNPIDGPGWTSAKKAIKYLTQKRARLVGENEIEFIQSDFRAQSAERTMTTTAEVPARAVAPSHRPALMVVPFEAPPPGSSLRTFAPYPIAWEGYTKAA